MGRRAGWIAFASTLATFGLLGWLVVNAPNWPAVQRSFFNGEEFGDALPAVRRVIPPLLNDFIGLQKDTVLVSFIGVVELFRTAQIKQAAHFNFTPYLAVAVVFLVLTLPLTRVTDWLIARDRARSSAGSRP